MLKSGAKKGQGEKSGEALTLKMQKEKGKSVNESEKSSERVTISRGRCPPPPHQGEWYNRALGSDIGRSGFRELGRWLSHLGPLRHELEPVQECTVSLTLAPRPHTHPVFHQIVTTL